MKIILALDQGTSSCRAIGFNQQGEAVSLAQREITQHFPNAAWVEHDAMEIWRTQLAVAIEAQGQHEIDAIAITNQRETTVIWNRETGIPIANAIVWQDQRTSELCATLERDGHGESIAAKTGLNISAYFSATKIKWLLDNVPNARKHAALGQLAVGTIDSWLIWNLTGGKVHVTDISNASRTLLFNIHTLEWDAALLDLFTIPRELLPRVVDSSGIVGETNCQGLPRGIPIAGVAGDQQAALFGQACFQPGMAKNTYGTGSFMLMNTSDTPIQSKNKLLTTVAWRMQNTVQDNVQNPMQTTTHYALEGSVFMGGAVIQWLRDGLNIIEHADDVEALAASVPDSGGVFLVPAFTGLGAPHWDGAARGLICGLTRGSNKAHIARAALESIAYQSAELLLAMQADAGIEITQLRVDGGASANQLLMQFQADILGIPVVRSAVSEASALGAALMAGIAIGYWKNANETAALWKADQTFTPQLSRELAAIKMHDWQRAVARARG